MPALPDPKRETFAQLCARGIPTVEAYVRAGYKRNTGNATSLKKTPIVAARIEELKDEISSSSQIELKAYMRDSGITPAYIVRLLLETALEAQKAGKFDTAARCFKDLGGELFGMFVQRSHIAVEKNSVHTAAAAPINIENLNSALEKLGDASPKLIEIDGHADVVDFAGTLLPAIPVERE